MNQVRAHLALQLDLLLILHRVSSLVLVSYPTARRRYTQGLPTLYGAYHFARRVFPLRHHCLSVCAGTGLGSWRGRGVAPAHVLPILDQDEGEHHRCGGARGDGTGVGVWRGWDRGGEDVPVSAGGLGLGVSPVGYFLGLGGLE